jgi:adenylate kinase
VRKFIIMGIQGSGKGTQAKLMAADLDLEHVSVGDIFRWNVQHHTKLGAQVKRTITAGHLVDDDLVEAVVQERLAAHDWNFGFIVDGFPRNARQAEFFLERYDIDGVINLSLPDEEVLHRIMARRLCAGAGSTTTSWPTARSGPTCATSVGASSWSDRTTTPRPWPSGWPPTTGRPSR